MHDSRLVAGDTAPDFRVMAAYQGEIREADLKWLLAGRKGLVLTGYVLDFTGG